MGVAAAVIAGGVAAGVGGSIFGGMFGASAEKKRAAQLREAGAQGANEMNKAAVDANRQAEAQLAIARGDLSPYQGYGKQSGDALMSMLLGGKSPGDLLKESELFKFQSDIGSRNINRELSARGLYGSGAGLEALAQFNNRLVGEEGQQLYNRLFNLTQLGYGAGGNMAGLTLRTGAQQSENIFNAGINAANLKYNSLVGSANATAEAKKAIGNMGKESLGILSDGLLSFGSMGMTGG